MTAPTAAYGVHPLTGALMAGTLHECGAWIADGVTVGPGAVLAGPATIWGGTIRGGTIEGGTIEGGTIEGGTIWGGTIRGGTIEGGTIEGGTIWGGTIRGGTIRGGTIEGGTIEGGAIWGGTIRGGDIRGGTIRGGDIWGGTIRGGTIRGGTIWGGDIRTTRDLLTLGPVGFEDQYVTLVRTDTAPYHELAVGCWQRHTIDELAAEVARRAPGHADEYAEIEAILRRRIAEWVSS